MNKFSEWLKLRNEALAQYWHHRPNPNEPQQQQQDVDPNEPMAQFMKKSPPAPPTRISPGGTRDTGVAHDVWSPAYRGGGKPIEAPTDPFARFRGKAPPERLGKNIRQQQIPLTDDDVGDSQIRVSKPLGKKKK